VTLEVVRRVACVQVRGRGAVYIIAERLERREDLRVDPRQTAEDEESRDQRQQVAASSSSSQLELIHL